MTEKRTRTESTRTHNRSLTDKQNLHGIDRRTNVTREASGHPAPEKGQHRDDAFHGSHRVLPTKKRND